MAPQVPCFQASKRRQSFDEIGVGAQAIRKSKHLLELYGVICKEPRLLLEKIAQNVLELSSHDEPFALATSTVGVGTLAEAAVGESGRRLCSFRWTSAATSTECT